RYEVTVIAEDKLYNSYVYRNPNSDPRWHTLWPESEVFMTLENHFTTFSFSGEVMVQIKLPQRTSISSVVVRPLSRSLAATVNGNTITVLLNSPANFFVEIEGEKRHPLFIFANPPEVDVPSPTDPDVIYFEPGIHEIGYKDGPMQNIPAGKTIYLAGGAYVKGALKMINGAAVTTVRGRGILSGIDIPGYSAYNGMIDAQQGTIKAEGIIVNDSPQGYQGIIAYGNGSVLDNVKMIAWAMEADAGSLGKNSQIKNCFFKICDDVLKPTASGMKITNNIVWQQMCGVVIMLGWNSVEDITGVTLSGLDIIGCDVGGITDPEATTLGIVNLRNSNGASIKNMVIENVRLEKKPFMMFAIDIKITDPFWVDNPRYNKGLGSVDGITFRNISVPEVPTRISYFNGNGNVTSESTGDIKNITLENMTIAGIKITEENASTYIARMGNTSNFIYK
ncbi:MAG: hypothetical protein ACK5HT_11000, partial [Draconibacterium sp.]